MFLSYRGERLAELVPSGIAARKVSPLEAMKRAQALTALDSSYSDRATSYLRALREDQKAWSERSTS